MKIVENIAAILQRELQASGMTKLEFSQELGIPRSTLQGYLKCTTCPRADSIETLADGLSISPAQLVSGLEGAQDAALPSLDALRRTIPTLHSQAQSIAEEAVDLWETALRTSAKLERLDALTRNAADEDAKIHCALDVGSTRAVTVEVQQFRPPFGGLNAL